MNNDIVLKVSNLSKRYRLGIVGKKTIKEDVRLFFSSLFQRGEDKKKVINNQSNYIWPLKDLNFEISRGDIVGVIGRNGAGKSTLLKILSRITAPTSGEIKIKGKVSSLLEVGTGFHPELTGRENIYLNGSILGMTKDEISNKIEKIIEFAEVERFIDTPVKRYSSGMYVRLAFSIAAHLEPDILILDEVLAVGDATFQKKCFEKIKDISQNQGRTILFVSHSMASVQNLCNKGIVLKNGRIEYYGEIKDAVSKYLAQNDLNKSSFLDLNSAKRSGNGDITVDSIRITDINDVPIDLIPSGSPVKFVLTYQNNFPNKKYSLVPGLVFKNKFDLPIFMHHSRLNDIVFDILPQKGEFVFILDNLPLVASKYFLEYSLVDHGIIIDQVNCQLEFEVVDGDFFKNGEMVPESHGIFLVNGNWINKNDNN
jgi:lipopolysaccharide transport system ATP-binding protein